ncbi:MAG: sulfotransferase [Prevotellaceae bacterium]|nr:sulfotransferase [Prevotellaceae bacterium]
MGLLEFSKLPVNTLVGADWKTFKELTAGQHIASDKRGKYLLTRAICRLLSLAVPLQDRKFRKLLASQRPAHDPLFILGHWRSGTTYVHNIFAQDPHFAFTTTYQTVFPHYVMALQGMFKPTMGWLMPEHRPTDNMELAPDLPQEEEFAFQNMCPRSYYNFWFFPERMQEYCDRYLTLRTATSEDIEAFKQVFDKLVRISIWNTRRGVKDAQYLSKNPPHTGRVKALVEMYPNAKFIYLMRNPYTVFESSRSFFANTIFPLQLHTISDEQMERNILRNYVELYRAYQEQKRFIPAGNLYEVKFEDIEQNALGIVEQIYSQLQLPGWDAARSAIESYIASKKVYKKNKYQYKPETVRKVNEAWGSILDEWGYERL